MNSTVNNTTVLPALSRRDAFAAAALQGLIASSPQVCGGKMTGTTEHAAAVAAACVRAADALIAALDGAA